MEQKQNIIEKLSEEVSFEMVFVEGGVFQMGSEEEEAWNNEKPIHHVQLDGYYIGKYPVTQAVWKTVIGNNPSYFQGSDRPVDRVSWKEAQEFIEKLNTKTRRVYRLPTEAEWEYAARGGGKREGYLYSGGNKLEDLGWYDENSFGATKPVGLLEPNELGLFDMSGNVREWCWDWYDAQYYKQCAEQVIVSNPQGPDKGTRFVLRGGSWDLSTRYCRVVHRSSLGLNHQNFSVGLRLVSSYQ